LDHIVLNNVDFLAQLDACLATDDLETVRARIADLRAQVAVWEPGGIWDSAPAEDARVTFSRDVL